MGWRSAARSSQTSCDPAPWRLISRLPQLSFDALALQRTAQTVRAGSSKGCSSIPWEARSTDSTGNMAVGGHGPWSAADKSVMVVGDEACAESTTTAIRRCGRSNLRVPVLPACAAGPREIFPTTFSGTALEMFRWEVPSSPRRWPRTPLFLPLISKTVVELTLRRALFAAGQHSDGSPPPTDGGGYARPFASIHIDQRRDALRWIRRGQDGRCPMTTGYGGSRKGDCSLQV